MASKLNIGCGTDIRQGWVNLDSVALAGVDVCHDITNVPLPFPDETFEVILCKDVLEHVEYIPVLKDLYRILQPGGRIHIQVPHFTSKDACGDPTHRNFFTVQTFKYFTRQHMRHYYFDFAFSRIERIWLSFDKRPGYFWNYLLEPMVNMHIRLLNFYEGSPLRLFPAMNIGITLVK
jgi:SAM-dependent methyltransferase